MECSVARSLVDELEPNWEPTHVKERPHTTQTTIHDTHTHTLIHFLFCLLLCCLSILLFITREREQKRSVDHSQFGKQTLSIYIHQTHTVTVSFNVTP